MLHTTAGTHRYYPIVDHKGRILMLDNLKSRYVALGSSDINKSGIFNRMVFLVKNQNWQEAHIERKEISFYHLN